MMAPRTPTRAPGRAAVQRLIERHEDARTTAEYREWSRERQRGLRAAVPLPLPGAMFETISVRELMAMTPADAAHWFASLSPQRAPAPEEPERPSRARFGAEYDWECAAIDREERTGMLFYRLAEYDVSPIVRRIGGWAITRYGIEKLYEYYPIERHRIHAEDDWVQHLAEKVSICPQSLADFTALHDIVRAADDAQAA